MIALYGLLVVLSLAVGRAHYYGDGLRDNVFAIAIVALGAVELFVNACRA